MIVLQNCKDELARIGRTLTHLLQAEAQQCQCKTGSQEVSPSEVSMCGCEHNACEIGDGPSACRTQTHHQTHATTGQA